MRHGSRHLRQRLQELEGHFERLERRFDQELEEEASRGFARVCEIFRLTFRTAA
jgi:hypothetical protein